MRAIIDVVRIGRAEASAAAGAHLAERLLGGDFLPALRRKGAPRRGLEALRAALPQIAGELFRAANEGRDAGGVLDRCPEARRTLADAFDAEPDLRVAEEAGRALLRLAADLHAERGLACAVDRLGAMLERREELSPALVDQVVRQSVGLPRWRELRIFAAAVLADYELEIEARRPPIIGRGRAGRTAAAERFAGNGGAR
ncbi:hypothetical protein LLG88_00610 [bacterium]|nr:hypothetical protein [bacterium]